MVDDQPRRTRAGGRAKGAPRRARDAAGGSQGRLVVGLQLVALAAIVLGYAAHARLLDARFQDDAFISFRYARNLAEGAGLVWNPGERVEGYTNFLWTVLLAVPFFASRSVDPAVVARLVSVASGCAAMAASFLLVRRLAPRARVLPLVPPLLLAGNWAFCVNTVTGLETVFFGALLTVGTALLVVELGDLRFRGASIAFALAALTRPEAIGLFVVLTVLVALEHRGGGAPARRHLVLFVAPFAALVGAHEVFRLAYYGALVPNTFVAKVGAGLPAGMGTRASYAWGFLAKGMDLLGVFSALAVLFAVARVRLAAARIVVAAALFGFASLALSGPDFMIGYRYLVPYLPLLYACTALGAAVVVDRVRRRDETSSGLEVEAALLVVAGFACAKWVGYSREVVRPFEELRRRVIADTSQVLGEWLGARLPAATLVVTLDIGELGYRSRLPILDISGLTDRAIARRPGNLLDRDLDLDDVFGREPGAFVLISRRPGPNKGPGPSLAYWPPRASRALLADPRMREGFVFAGRWPDYDRLAPDASGSWTPLGDGEHASGEKQSSYFLELYLRKDVAAAQAARRAGPGRGSIGSGQRRAAADERVVDGDEHDGAEDRHEEAAGRLVRRVEADRAPDEPAEQRAEDAEGDRHDEAHGLAPRREQLRDHPDDQAEQNPHHD
jgi:hypothetical protein